MDHQQLLHGPSSLQEREGVEQPSHINPRFLQNRPTAPTAKLTVDDYVEGILSGNRTLLSKAITLIESTLAEDIATAQKIIERCLPHAGNSFRLGITGVPGAGKSTFIEALGSHLVRTGKKLAVLAIDPSSGISKGSVLGDKTRMEELSAMENAFIRPSPSAGSLGGVARKTRESIILCEAAGFTHIIVETVGVGQSETEAHNMVDYFLLLQLANLGDELQGIKRGIVEMADGIAINKADGDFEPKAKLAQRQLRNAIALFPIGPSGLVPTVETCSAKYKKDIDRIWNHILEFEAHCKRNGSFERRRKEQLGKVFQNHIEEQLRLHFYNQKGLTEEFTALQEKVRDLKASPYTAGQSLVDRYFESLASGVSEKRPTPKTAQPLPTPSVPIKPLSPKLRQLANQIPHFGHALAVDAACAGNPGKMEYQGVQVNNGKIIFKMGPYPDATNNIGEFLAIVHALSFLNARGFSHTPIYSDSVTGMAWVRKKKANTKLIPTARNREVIDLIERAEKWLHTHTYSNPILKWDTDKWGEIPADFGRK